MFDFDRLKTFFSHQSDINSIISETRMTVILSVEKKRKSRESSYQLKEGDTAVV